MTTTYIIITAVILIGAFLYLRPKSSKVTFNNLSVSELGPLMRDKDTVLIDVRTQKEINEGIIGKQLEIQLGPAMNKELSSLDKNKKYVVYCRSGRRSVLASNMMVKMGYTDVNNLVGGYNAWSQK